VVSVKQRFLYHPIILKCNWHLKQ